MNTINFSQIATQTVRFFNDQAVLPSTTSNTLQKKIMLIVIAIFAGIAFFLIEQCLKKREKLELPAPIQNEKWVNEVGGQMIESMHGELDCAIESEGDTFNSAICFVNVRFTNGNIRQQYIFKNQDGSSLRKEDCANQINKILESLKGDLKENFGQHQAFHWFILFNGIKKFVKAQGHNAALSQYSVGRISASQQAISAFMQLGLNSLGDDMGIPKETSFIENGEFVQGEFYRDLDDPVP